MMIFIFFYHHRITKLWVNKMDIRCCVYWKFSWYFFCLVCKGSCGQRNCRHKRVISPLSPVFINTGFTWVEYCTKECHNTTKSGKYKITDGEMVQKWHTFFVPPELLFFLILLLLVTQTLTPVASLETMGRQRH